MRNTVQAGPTPGPSIAAITRAYLSGSSSPSQEVDRVLQRIADRGDDGTWITVVDGAELLLRARELEAHPDPTSLPLYGIPFGVKDSIDVCGVPTTLACPDYAYVADRTAPAVGRLMRAGAIFVGKTNLDQFATGLNGTRTPYTVPRSVFGRDLISGGSSSGSALAVAGGSVPFTLATDTAGSGRVPPALNGVVGLKPSRGLISTVGLVPACRSLDCVSLIAGDFSDAAHVLDVIAGVDHRDPYSRQRRREAVSADALRVGLPDAAELEFFGDTAMRDAHLGARAVIAERFSRVVQTPFTPFLAAGELLYQGPWVAERLAEFGTFLGDNPGGVLPVIRTILEGGARYSAVDVFAAEHRLGELKAEVAALWEHMDVLVLPAVGTTFTVAEVLADPIRTNTVLGHYTHFGNLLDLCAAVVPAGTTADGRPAALMVLGPALADDRVLAMSAALSAAPAHYAFEGDALDPASTTTAAEVGRHPSASEAGRPTASEAESSSSVAETGPSPSATESMPGNAPPIMEVSNGFQPEIRSAATETPGGSGSAPTGAAGPTRCTLVVVGHHLSGEPRNGDLLDHGGVLMATTRTAARYRLVRIGVDAPVPALVAVPRGGAAIEVETWSVPAEACVSILAASSGSVCLGRVELADRTTHIGFVGDAAAMATDAITDITEYGGWRSYLAAGSPVG